MKLIFLITLTFTTLITFGQDTTKVPVEKREGYKHWTKYKTSLRLGIGIQKSFYSELGISRHKYMYNDLGYASTTYYTSIEMVPSFSEINDNTYGFKVGYEINARILALGLEVKYQSDFTDNDLIITPKIGFGVLGIVNLFYGFNISTTRSPFSNIGHNQFSMVCNLNRGLMKKMKKSDKSS